LAVGGHSAGGHLAALATLHSHALPNAGVSSRVLRACFPVSTSFNLHYPNAQPGSGEERVYKTLLADPADDHVASPINYLSPAAPPFHIVVGENDFDRIKRTSRDMMQAMSNRTLRARFEEWKGCDHFGTHLELTNTGHPWFGMLREVLAAVTPEKEPC
jgi:acetyl esterase/lipase